jgi:type IV pilus assembly protein PilB
MRQKEGTGPTERPARNNTLKELTLIFEREKGPDEVRLIPSEEGKSLPCQWTRCSRPSRFYIQRKNVPTAGCLDCILRIPATGVALKIGDIAKKRQFLNQEQIRRVLEQQKQNLQKPDKKSAKKFIEIAVELGMITPQNAMLCLSEMYRFKYLDLGKQNPAEEFLKMIPAEICRTHKVICVGRREQTFLLAMADPLDEEALLAVAQSFQRPFLRLTPYLAWKEAIERAMTSKDFAIADRKELPEPTLEATLIDLSQTTDDDIKLIDDIEETGPTELPEALTRRAYNATLREAFKRGASDIHVEPYDRQRYMIRYRIDGVLQIPRKELIGYGLGIIRCVKYDANIDTGNRPDRVYEGSYPVEYKEKRYRLRVEYLPTYIGSNCLPKVTIRVLDTDSRAKTLDDLGYDEHTKAMILRATKQPNGLILFAGSTGMGKSTSLAAIARMKAVDPVQEIMIYSLEDPIEYEIPGVNQIEVDTREEMAGVRDYHSLLRAIQRSDPNMVMVGEVRDEETAGSALRIAVAGNLVCASIHAGDSPGVITRLRNYGLEDFLIGDYTRLVVSQRLVRLLCPVCKQRDTVTAEWIRAAGFHLPDEDDQDIFFPNEAGCDSCSGGYRGRTAIAEAMLITPRLRDMIVSGKPERRIQREAILEGMVTLRASGLRLIRKGDTSIAEVQRITGDFPDPTVEAMQRRKETASEAKEFAVAATPMIRRAQ